MNGMFEGSRPRVPASSPEPLPLDDDASASASARARHTLLAAGNTLSALALRSRANPELTASPEHQSDFRAAADTLERLLEQLDAGGLLKAVTDG